MQGEKGFFHPDRGYWQTTNAPDADILASYPEGTITVPLKPGAEYDWQDGEWVHVPPTVEELRARMPSLSQKQFRLALIQHGHSTSAIRDLLGTIPDQTEKETSQTVWDYGESFSRGQEFVPMLSALLNITDEDMDAIWNTAAGV